MKSTLSITKKYTKIIRKNIPVFYNIHTHAHTDTVKYNAAELG